MTMLHKLSSAKSCGPSSISTNLLKTHAKMFYEHLKLVTNNSFAVGKFPDLLKIASVCPIYKKRRPQQVRKLQTYFVALKLEQTFWACYAHQIVQLSFFQQIFVRSPIRLSAIVFHQSRPFKHCWKNPWKSWQQDFFLWCFCWSWKSLWYC